MDELWPGQDSDTCDRCPAPAKIRVFITHTALTIDLCAHHFRQNEAELTEKGYMWIDGRSKKEKFTKTLQDITA